MDFKRVRTFVTVAEHGTKSRILHDGVTQTGPPKNPKRPLTPSSAPRCFLRHYSLLCQALRANAVAERLCQ